MHTRIRLYVSPVRVGQQSLFHPDCRHSCLTIWLSAIHLISNVMQSIGRVYRHPPPVRSLQHTSLRIPQRAAWRSTLIPAMHQRCLCTSLPPLIKQHNCASSVTSKRHLQRCFWTAASSPALSKPQVLILAGPTGIGKTHLSLALARALNGEIISADSIQQYRGMDIGSAKVSKETRQQVPHHCIDTASVSSPVTVDFFSTHAHAAIKQILLRGKLPIVVGGSGFYLRWLIKPGAINEITPQMRDAVEEVDGAPRENKMKGDITEDQLVKEWTQKLDRLPKEFELQPAGRKHFLHLLRTHPQALLNRHWVRKSLEMILANGGHPPLEYTPPTIEAMGRGDMLYDYRCFYLTCDREWLNRWTDVRCEQMVQAGLLQEVKRLEIMQNLSDKSTLAAAVGYRQTLAYLKKSILPVTLLLPTEAVVTSPAQSQTLQQHQQQLQTLPSSLVPSLHAFPDFLSSFQSASRSLIRTQDIWFRKEPWYHYLHLTTPALPTGENFSRTISSVSEMERVGAVPREEWMRLEREIVRQMKLSQQMYWSQPQWSSPPTSSTPSAWADGAFEWKKVLKSEEELEAERRDAETAVVGSDAAVKALPFSPSASLTASIQQQLRAQTNLAGKQHQKLRRNYVSHPLVYTRGTKGQKEMERAVMAVAMYDPHSDQLR